MQNSNANIIVVRAQTGQPHAGKVFAAVHAHQIDRKIEAIAQCESPGGGNGGSLLRARSERERKRLADRQYIRQFLLDDSHEAGKRYSLAHAEQFYYMDLRQPSGSKVDEHVEKHAVRL